MMDINILYNMYSYSSKQDILNYLNQCDCCIRHQNNKPHICNSLNVKNKKRKKYTNECECKCRHYAREISKNRELIFYLEDFI